MQTVTLGALWAEPWVLRMHCPLGTQDMLCLPGLGLGPAKRAAARYRAFLQKARKCVYN